MVAASVAKSRVAYISEVTWGTTPTTPTFLTLRRTSGNLQTRKTTVVSEEINLDRNVREVYQTAQDVAGTYDFELSYGTLDDLLAGALQGTWSTNVLTVGGTQQSFTFEETVDLGGSSSYARFVGCEVNQLSLNLAARQAVRGSVSLMGQKETLATSVISGATYTAANSNAIDTGVSFATLTLAGLSPLPRIKTLSLQISNGLRVRDGLGDLYTTQFGTGQCEITGTIEAYFESNALYQAVLDHGGGQLQFTIGGVTNKKYTLNMPAVKFLDGSRRLGGRNDDVMVSIPFQAVGTSGTPSMTVTRAVS